VERRWRVFADDCVASEASAVGADDKAAVDNLGVVVEGESAARCASANPGRSRAVAGLAK
jgi:hypothetical protein